MQEFEYFYTQQVNGILQVDNIGECCIEACTDMHECYYLIIRTSMGASRVFQYGPIVPESEILEKSCTCSFKRLDFNEIKLGNIIKNFLNKPYANITQAQEISIEKFTEEELEQIDLSLRQIAMLKPLIESKKEDE